jgi:hypothetical protein
MSPQALPGHQLIVKLNKGFSSTPGDFSEVPDLNLEEFDLEFSGMRIFRIKGANLRVVNHPNGDKMFTYTFPSWKEMEAQYAP